MIPAAINQSRRTFLQRVSRLALAGIAAPWAASFAALGEASAANASDYKALVCVYLLGGNDYANTFPRYDIVGHTAYQAARPTFAHRREALEATLLNPSTIPVDSAGLEHEYALAPGLSALLPLFSAGEMAVVLNVGTLIEPTSKQQYLAKSVRLPPKLFSHHDQSGMWQSLSPEGAHSGWGGRIGDLLQATNDNASFTCINLSGNAVYLRGQNVTQYRMSTRGPVPLAGLESPLFGSSTASASLHRLITEPRHHRLEGALNEISGRALAAKEILTEVLARAPELATPFPVHDPLAEQLQMVARMIAAAPALGTKRQVFFVALGDFDHHYDIGTEHPALMAKLGNALAAFSAAIKELGRADAVTTFTASEFGRSLMGNGRGSEHGWGGMQLVTGAAVKGQRFYGIPPIIADDGPDDVGQGRLIPTTSVEQMAATLGSWMGVSDSDLLSLLPNLSNYNPSDRRLGFL